MDRGLPAAPFDISIHSDCLSDESGFAGRAEYAAFPENEEELRNILRYCGENSVRCTAQGGLTGISAGAVADGGCIINLSKMKGTGDIQQENGVFFIDVKAGVSLEEIQSKAGERGLMFAPDPSETSALAGGLFCVNAKGGNSVKYGGVGQNTLAAELMLASGEKWRIERGEYIFDERGISLPDGRRWEADMDFVQVSGILNPQPGTDLLDLLSGSSGRFGIVTGLRLKLIPKESSVWAVVFFFESFEKAIGFCEKINSGEADLCGHIEKIELLDEKSLGLIDETRRNSSELKSLAEFEENWNSAVMVWISGKNDSEEALMQLLELFDGCGGGEDDTWAFEGIREASKASAMRHALSEGVTGKVAGLKKGYGKAHVISVDFSVPPEKLRELCMYYKNTLSESKLDGAVFGHACAARMHGVIFAGSEAEQEAAETLAGRWADMVLNLGGRLFEENGIGRSNEKLFFEKISEKQREAVESLRMMFDPEGIFN